MIELIPVEQVFPEGTQSIDQGNLLAYSQGRSHGERYPFPSFSLGLKLLSTSFRQRIELCAPIGLRLSPGGFEPASLFQAVEGRKQRTCLHIEGFIGHLRDSAGYTHAMQLLECEGLKNQDIEGTLQQIGLRSGHEYSY